MTELQPCAMLPNGPPWISAGLPSSVCTRFGASALPSNAAIAPCAPRSLACTGRWSRVYAQTMLPSRRLRSLRDVREAEDRHHLRRRDDVEAVLARIAVARSAEADGQLAQRAIVHVDDALPHDAPHVDAERVAVMDVVVDQRGEQVVRDGDRVEVAGEMQVDVLHRHDLRVAAARRAALHAEDRPERRLAQAGDGARADAVQRIGQPDGRRRLAFAGRRRADRRHEHELAAARDAVCVASQSSETFALYRPYGSSASSGMPSLRAIAAIGASFVACAISMSVFTSFPLVARCRMRTSNAAGGCAVRMRRHIVSYADSMCRRKRSASNSAQRSRFAARRSRSAASRAGFVGKLERQRLVVARGRRSRARAARPHAAGSPRRDRQTSSRAR